MSDDEPYHDGERAVQERAGVRAAARKIGRVIGDAITPAVAEFLARRITLYVGSIDAAGRVWASQLTGPPGFVTASDAHTVRIDAGVEPGDPLRDDGTAGARLALLALDPATRRRVRVNGRVERADRGEIVLRVRETFGNCPKYIQAREPVAVEDAAARPVERGARLTPAARALVARADTAFLASAHPEAGADVSHRGGTPGFIRVEDDRTLAWGDYQGNMMFQSLGNLAVDARAGLLIVDFDGTSTLQLTGTAVVDWSVERAERIPGAQRVVEYRVDEVVENPRGNPIRWRLLEPSPHNPARA